MSNLHPGINSQSNNYHLKPKQKMEKIIAEIKAQINANLADIDNIDNKAANARVRKASLK